MRVFVSMKEQIMFKVALKNNLKSLFNALHPLFVMLSGQKTTQKDLLKPQWSS